MKVELKRGQSGTYELESESGESVLFQTDWDFPGTASSYGWQACECGETDGTIDCAHKTASEMIGQAADYLDEHIGDVIDDPGYFG